jgi:carbonic anhydrase
MNQPVPSLSNQEALQKLIEGNRRYVSARAEHPNQAAARREEVRAGQQPFAVVLGCSDSRVPPEIIFDQGIGDLFVIRVAGNTAHDSSIMGSIEYAVEHLGTPLVVVLGHEKCGAVTAAVEAVETDTTLPGHLDQMIAPIKPAVQQVQNKSGNLIENAIQANIEMVVAHIQASQPIVAHFVQEGNVKIVGACYSLQTGVVEFVTGV